MSFLPRAQLQHDRTVSDTERIWPRCYSQDREVGIADIYSSPGGPLRHFGCVKLTFPCSWQLRKGGRKIANILA